MENSVDEDERRLQELQAMKSQRPLEREERRQAYIAAAEMEHINFWLDKSGKDSVPSVITRTSKNPYIDSFDLVWFWTNPDRKLRYPIMYPLIMKVLSCMLSNTDVERVRSR